MVKPKISPEPHDQSCVTLKADNLLYIRGFASRQISAMRPIRFRFLIFRPKLIHFSEDQDETLINVTATERHLSTANFRQQSMSNQLFVPNV